MPNEVMYVNPVSEETNAQIVDNVCKFVNLLGTEEMSETTSKLTIIPNILKDILSLPLEHKRLNIQNQNTLIKAELAKQYLTLVDQNNARDHKLQREKIISDFSIAMHQIETQERTTLEKYKLDYELEIRRIDEKSKAFHRWFDLLNKEIDAKSKERSEAQKELTLVMKALTSKLLSAGTLSEYENQVLQMVIKAITDLCQKSDLQSILLDFFTNREE